jgi:putative membrane protein
MDLSTLLRGWSLEPQIDVPLVLGGLLYALGLRYSRQRGISRYLQWWHIAAFYGGLAIILLALESPIDAYADTFFWLHMLQHELLVMGAAPLLVLGAPLWPLWRALPRSARRGSLRWILRIGWPRRWWHAISRVVGRPQVAWVLFIVVFSAWHLPALYDLTLENQLVHNLEHILFLTTAMFFWAQIIPSPPFQPRLGYVKRSAFLIAAGIEMNVLAFVLATAPTPSYPYYAALPRTADMISAVSDQHAAAGIMDVPSTILIVGTVMAMLGLWLIEDERQAANSQPQPGVTT